MKILTLLPNWGVKTHDRLIELKRKKVFEKKKIVGFYSFVLFFRETGTGNKYIV